MSKSFAAESTTDEVLEGVKSERQARAGDRRISRPRRRDRPRARGAWRRSGGAARDLTKAKAATAPARADAANGGSLELVELDLASLASVRACAARSSPAASRSTSSFAMLGSWRRRPARRRTGSRRNSGPTSRPFRAGQSDRIADEAGSAARQLPSAGHQLSDVDLDDPNFERTPYSAWAPMAARRQPTSCSRSSSTAATRIVESAPPLFHPGRFIPSSAAT